MREKEIVGLENKLVLNLEEASATTLKGFAFSLFWLLREDAMTATDICFSLCDLLRQTIKQRSGMIFYLLVY